MISNPNFSNSVYSCSFSTAESFLSIMASQRFTTEKGIFKLLKISFTTISTSSTPRLFMHPLFTLTQKLLNNLQGAKTKQVILTLI
ncbi:hypothetical protein APR42_15540 [Salegentibacter mishustinae]|uniref:Uncharacterized protein n=1 Tax=Salegentibacter mishustinae TaxID=270918 RepID=A0A0Q9ZMK6_9FLAO|nr:hypothetical protein APR42_15540 [Salegentibacter mishustinae]PNW21285.1 hypothetical protein APB85_08480 [Salegentibacter mishustinae]